jgi:hypothetical protein
MAYMEAYMEWRPFTLNESKKLLSKFGYTIGRRTKLKKKQLSERLFKVIP